MEREADAGPATRSILFPGLGGSTLVAPQLAACTGARRLNRRPAHKKAGPEGPAFLKLEHPTCAVCSKAQDLFLLRWTPPPRRLSSDLRPDIFRDGFNARIFPKAKSCYWKHLEHCRVWLHGRRTCPSVKRGVEVSRGMGLPTRGLKITGQETRATHVPRMLSSRCWMISS